MDKSSLQYIYVVSQTMPDLFIIKLYTTTVLLAW